MLQRQITLGVSCCLLGEQVRYDGGHKRHHYLTDQLAPHVRFVSVCPEVECGLPTPREPMRLHGDVAKPQLVTIRSGHDLTEQLQSWCLHKTNELAALSLRGFIFKKNSPSCGLHRVKIYQDKGPPLTSGRGLFAELLTSAFPLMPVEEEGRLADARLRENFIEQVYCYDRLLQLLAAQPDRAALIRFHTAHKLLLMAHSVEHYRATGSLVASQQPFDQLLREYSRLFMAGLRLLATPAKQTNVLLHCLGYFKRQLEAWEKHELLALIQRYRAGQLPLIVPVTLFTHYIRRFNQSYLAEQLYFAPHPDELMLRNHA